jgi:plastocyanin
VIPTALQALGGSGGVVPPIAKEHQDMTSHRPEMRTPEQSERQDEASTLVPAVTRRRLIVGAAGAGAALAAVPALGATLPRDVLFHGGDDHDDDDKDDDRHDDNATAGADHDDDHDDLDDDAVTASEAGILEVHIIDDDEDGFFPSVLEIDAGQTVTFYNDDDDEHTATGSDWDTGDLHPGDSAEVTFDIPGSYAYSCQYHPVMMGTIEVRGAGTPEASPAASPAAAGDASAMVVAIVNFAFDPAEIDVPVGATVTWNNEDAAAHTATSTDGSTFDTGTLDQGEQGSHTFTEAGTFEYQCAIHPSMTGVVTVS